MKRYLLVAVIAFVFFLFIQMQTPNIVGKDAHYHIKHAEIIKEQGLVTDFPWWQHSVFVDGYADEYFLYHILLVPFTFLGLAVGAKISAAFFAAMMTMVFYLVMKQEKIKNPEFWTILLVLGSAKLLYRLMYPRAIALAIILILLYYLFLRKKNNIGLGIVSFVFVWSYPAPYLLLVLMGPYVLFNWKRYKVLYWTIGGLIAGYIVNPYFPANIHVLFTHGYHMMLTSISGTELAIGTEMKPPTVWPFIKDSILIFTLFIATAIMGWKKYPHLLVSSGFFICLSFVVMRSIEYAVPLTVLFAALVFHRRLKLPKIKKEVWAVFILILLVFVFVGETKMRYDERYHLSTISYFMGDDPHKHPFLSMLPGYHAIMSVFAKILGFSLLILRGINVVFGVASAYVFYLIAKHIHRKDNDLRAFQFLFNPIVFVFSFMVYTEMLSSLLLLLCYYAAQKGRFYTSGLIGLVSLTVRQNNIVWVGLIWLVFLFSDKDRIAYLKKSITYYLTFISFIVFVVVNKGFAVGDRDMHPTMALHLGNSLYFPILMLILFLPIFITNIPRTISFCKKHIPLTIGIVLTLIFAAFNWVMTHPYNLRKSDISPSALMKILTYNSDARIAFAVLLIVSVLILINIRLKKPEYYLVYPIGLVLLSVTWLIQPRYHLGLIIFFMLFRKIEDKKWEYAYLTWSIVLSLASVVAITYTRFFL